MILIFTVLLLALKIPYVVPVAVGLLATPLAAVSVACGTVVYYLLTNISDNATTISSMGRMKPLPSCGWSLTAYWATVP